MNRPAELESLARHRSLYVRSRTEDGPRIEVDRVEQDGDSDLWRVQIPAEENADEGAILGRSNVRMRPEEILGEVDSTSEFHAYKPEWADSLPTARVLPDPGAESMRRLNRRRLVRPFTTRFPPEERQVFRDASWPWGLVCKVFTNTRPNGAGTASLIGPRLAVTAGHVVPSGDPWSMRIVPAYFDGASLHGAGVESFVSDVRGYFSGGVVGYDWAILRLYEPLGGWLGHFGSNSYDDDWEDEPYWTHVGYPSAIDSQRPSRQFGVSVFDDDSDSNGGQELETRADMSPGNSGGPMFGWWSGEPRLIGVVSGEEYDNAFPSGEWGNVVAGGDGFHNLIRWGRTNWP